jgi:hypothetical protein
MQREAKGRGPVFRMPSIGSQSHKLRVYLTLAGVARADLFESDATRKAMTFHGLRATGITWCAVRGDDPLKITQRAGHADFTTTQIYLREAENLAAGFGTVVPPLPPDLLAKPARARGVSASAFGIPRSWPLPERGTCVRSGADENRTRDLLHAMQALSQLSYSPDTWERTEKEA